MLSKIIPRLTYANVVATGALFLALGGGAAIAADRLARNSVGSAQIRAGAVGSAEVRDRSLRLGDLSSSARTSLRGQRGPIGPQGPAGPAVITYFAAFGQGGDLLRGNVKGYDHSVGGSGIYRLVFARDVSACVYAATIGTADTSAAPVGLITVSAGTDGGLVVHTTDVAGTSTDLPFHLIVAC